MSSHFVIGCCTCAVPSIISRLRYAAAQKNQPLHAVSGIVSMFVGHVLPLRMEMWRLCPVNFCRQEPEVTTLLAWRSWAAMVSTR